MLGKMDVGKAMATLQARNTPRDETLLAAAPERVTALTCGCEVSSRAHDRTSAGLREASATIYS
jgi:hypothetical protein